MSEDGGGDGDIEVPPEAQAWYEAWKPAAASDEETLKESLEESRAVLNRQRETLSEIDDTALRTGRTAVLILTLTVSAFSIGGGEPIDALFATRTCAFRAVATGGLVGTTRDCAVYAPYAIGHGLLAGVLLVGCLLVSTYVSAESNPPAGTPARKRERPITESLTTREWRTTLIQYHTNWTEDFGKELQDNADGLTLAQVLLAVGVTALMLSFFFGLLSHLGLTPSSVFSGLLFPAAVILYGLNWVWDNWSED